MRVVALLSGGLDSATVAKVLADKGEDVIGVTLNLGESRCCELNIARNVCHRIGISHYVFNIAKSFDEEVIRPYHEDLFSGITPNPCPICNIKIKFKHGLRIADEIGADGYAPEAASAVELCKKLSSKV